MDVDLRPPRRNDFADEIRAIRDFIIDIENDLGSGEVLSIHFDNINFVHPHFILLLSCYIDYLDREGHRIEIKHPAFSNVKSYLNTICFPRGLQLDSNTDYEKQLKKYRTKKYLPIIRFDVKCDPVVLNSIFSQINNFLISSLNLSHNISSGLSYLISEITDNIIEHSKCGFGWLNAQFYQYGGYLDICIIDNGQGIYQSYHNSVHKNLVHNDEEAIKQAIKGLSTKTEKDRGHGIRTSRNVAIDGLKGRFALVSGNIIYLDKTFLDFKSNWPGTAVFFRIESNLPEFNILDYVEG